MCDDRQIATLLHLNGPPAVGKSAIAALLVAERPLALNLDIDEIRVRLGRWESHPDSKHVARQLGFMVASAHLRSGHDVVMPQLTASAEVIDRLERLALEAGGLLCEVILVADPGELVERAWVSRNESPHPRDQFSRDELDGQVRHATGVLHELAAMHPSFRLVDLTGLSVTDAAKLVRESIS